MLLCLFFLGSSPAKNKQAKQQRSVPVASGNSNYSNSRGATAMASNAGDLVQLGLVGPAAAIQWALALHLPAIQ